MYYSVVLSWLLLIARLFTTVLAQVDLFIVKDPHIISVNQGYEVCDYDSATWFSCLDSPFLKVDCKFTQISNIYGLTGPLYPTYLSSIYLKFENPSASNAETYSAFDPNNALKTTFDSGSTMVADNLGNPWLAIYTTTNLITIQDMNTLSTITISVYPGLLYNFYITTDPATTAFASGLLISGCPNGFVVPYSGRRRRSIAECQNLPKSSYPVLNDNLLSICEHDIKFEPEIPKTLALTVKEFDTHKEYHTRLIETNMRKKN